MQKEFGALIHLFFDVHFKSKLIVHAVLNYLPFPRIKNYDRMARILIVAIWIPFSFQIFAILTPFSRYARSVPMHP